MSFPVWTPDGEYILGAQNLYHLAGGEGVRVPFGAGVTGFSPDGKRAYTSNRTGQIIVYDRSTGRTHTLVSNPGGAMQVAVSPDGKKLAYFTRHDSRTALMLRDIESGDEKVLRDGRAARRQPARGQPRRDAEPGLAAGRVGDPHDLRRQDLEDRRGDRQGDDDSVHAPTSSSTWDRCRASSIRSPTRSSCGRSAMRCRRPM